VVIMPSPRDDLDTMARELAALEAAYPVATRTDTMDGYIRALRARFEALKGISRPDERQAGPAGEDAGRTGRRSQDAE
jgi:hypothetical protein